MKNYLLIITAILVILPVYSLAQTNLKRPGDEKAIRQIVQNIQDAWAAGDAVKFADQFTDDVDYTVWNGMYLNGREANMKGHQEIFDTFYKGTKIETEIKKIRFLTDEVATVHLESKMYRGDNPMEGVPTVVPLMVLKKENGKWKVAVFQNTPIIQRGELVVGRKTENGEK